MNQWFDDCDNYGMDDLAWYKPYAIEIGGNIREQRNELYKQGILRIEWYIDKKKRAFDILTYSGTV